jgi:seryl-tRNA synthetase
MRITKTTLRRIIKEELDAVMYEDRADHVAGIEAKIKRLEAEVERAQERRDEIGSDPAHENPGLSKTYRELGVRIENMEDKLDTLRKQREELSEARPAANAPRHKYIEKKVKKDGKPGTVVAARKVSGGPELSIKFDDPKLGVVRTLASSSDLEFLK